jgi:hypothetical protein
VVVDGDRERPLGCLLADDVLLQDLVDLTRFRQVLELDRRRRRELLVDDLVAEVDALVADVDPGPGDQLFDLALRLAAEAAEELLVRVCRACQGDLLLAKSVVGPPGSRSLKSLDAAAIRSVGCLGLRRTRRRPCR